MENSLKKIEEIMDTDRTNGLFDSSIKRSGALIGEEYTLDDLKKMKIVLGAGNLHVNTAKTKMGAIKLLGYRNSLDETKKAVERKIRNSRKYGS